MDAASNNVDNAAADDSSNIRPVVSREEMDESDPRGLTASFKADFKIMFKSSIPLVFLNYKYPNLKNLF